MNVVFLLCDTLTREKLSPYHRGEGPYAHIRTPNLDRLAERSTTFTNHWINSAPCMPARRDLCSGRIEFPWRSWGPRESFDPDWARTLREHTNVSTCFVTDHANMFDVGSGNYHQWFDEWHFTRGHFNDHCAAGSPPQPGRAGQSKEIYRKATEEMDTEEKSFVARNFDTATRYLDDRANDQRPFFLYIDEFDPHWPLDPPEPYRSMYVEDDALKAKGGPAFFKGNDASEYTEDELTWMQAQFAGKITMVDNQIGRLLDTMDRHDLWDDTLFILTTDHGEYLGEYGQVSKGGGPCYPLFSRIPLFVHLPGGALNGQTSNALTSTVDLHATILEALNAPVSPHTHSQSILPVLRKETETVRTDVLFGWWGRGFYWTDGQHFLCKGPEQKGPLYQYGTDLGEKYVGLTSEYFDRYADAETGPFMPHTDRLVHRVPADGMAYGNPNGDHDQLFDLNADPTCKNNLFNKDESLRITCLARLKSAMEAHEVPKEHYERLGLS